MALKFTFPKTENFPAILYKIIIYFIIPLNVSFYLFVPKLTIRFMVIFMNQPIFTMPKIPITKNRNFMFSNGKIRLAKYVFIIFMISNTCIPKKFPKQYLY